MFRREIQKVAVARKAAKVSQKNQDCSWESPARVVRSRVDRVLQKSTDWVPIIPLNSAYVTGSSWTHLSPPASRPIHLPAYPPSAKYNSLTDSEPYKPLEGLCIPFDERLQPLAQECGLLTQASAGRNDI